jgi:ABC-type branched-subunit amino acid transport system ATPase component
VITRLYRPDGGRVLFAGRDLTRTPAHRIVRLGISRTFQNVVLFPRMTVLENVMVGTHSRRAFFAERHARRDAEDALAAVLRSDVQVRFARNGVRAEIQFKNLDEIHALVDHLRGRLAA